MTKRETHRKPEAELTEYDRARIADARSVLDEYGLKVVDEHEPLTELGYEQRMARGRALEAAVALMNAIQPAEMMTTHAMTTWAGAFYEFIWEGKHA